VSRARHAAASLILALAALLCAGQEPAPAVDLESLKWEKDFELVLELACIPTKGQVELERKIASLEEERAALMKKKERLSARLDRLNSTYTSDQLYDEMLEEETTDLSSTKDSIALKLAAVNEKLDDVDGKLRKLYPERIK